MYKITVHYSQASNFSENINEIVFHNVTKIHCKPRKDPSGKDVTDLASYEFPLNAIYTIYAENDRVVTIDSDHILAMLIEPE